MSKNPKPQELKVWVHLEDGFIFFNWHGRHVAKTMRAMGYIRATILLPARKERGTEHE